MSRMTTEQIKKLLEIDAAGPGIGSEVDGLINQLSRSERAPTPSVLSFKQMQRDLEVNLIIKALKQTDGNRTQAARLLEISHRALLYKIREYTHLGLMPRS